MAHILPPMTQVLLPEQNALGRFRRALRHDDRRVLDDLLDAAQEHAEPTLSIEMLVLFMLLAEGREALRLRQQIGPYSNTAQEAALWFSPGRTPQDG